MRKEYFQLLEEIKLFFKDSKKSKAVVGLSGGLDSALTLRLVADAIGSKEVTAIIMPELGLTSKQNINDAKKFAKSLKIKHFFIDISPMLESVGTISWKQSKLALMQAKARLRSNLLYNYAESFNALVCGTKNKSEIMLGYGIKYGDFASDVHIIGDLLKTQVIELAKYLEIPECFVTKEPTPELAVGQKTEEELGASFSQIDAILTRYLNEERLNKKENLIKKTLLRVETEQHRSSGVPSLSLA